MDENTNMNTNMNTEQEPEPEQQQIIIPMNIMNIMDMMNMMNTDNVPQMNPQSLEERVTQESFHQPKKFKHVSSKDFINSLSVQKVSDEMIKEKTTCALCLDELELNELNGILQPIMMKAMSQGSEGFPPNEEVPPSGEAPPLGGPTIDEVD